MTCDACIEMCVERATPIPHACDGRPAVSLWVIFRRDGMYRVSPVVSIEWQPLVSSVALPAPSLSSARALLPVRRRPAPLPTWFPGAVEAWVPTSISEPEPRRPNEDAVPSARADGPTEPNDDVYVPEGACPLCLQDPCFCAEPLR